MKKITLLALAIAALFAIDTYAEGSACGHAPMPSGKEISNSYSKLVPDAKPAVQAQPVETTKAEKKVVKKEPTKVASSKKKK